MKSVIQNHNTNLLSKQTTPVAARSCSCRQKSECPLNNDESDDNDDDASIKQQFHKHLHK